MSSLSFSFPFLLFFSCEYMSTIKHLNMSYNMVGLELYHYFISIFLIGILPMILVLKQLKGFNSWFLFFFLRRNSHKIKHFKMYNSVVFSTLHCYAIITLIPFYICGLEWKNMPVCTDRASFPLVLEFVHYCWRLVSFIQQSNNWSIGFQVTGLL